MKKHNREQENIKPEKHSWFHSKKDIEETSDAVEETVEETVETTEEAVEEITESAEEITEESIEESEDTAKETVEEVSEEGETSFIYDMNQLNQKKIHLNL